MSGPGPLAVCGGELDSRRRAWESGVGPLRWARCPDQVIAISPATSAWLYRQITAEAGDYIAETERHGGAL